jgi:hypothetical protein
MRFDPVPVNDFKKEALLKDSSSLLFILGSLE